MSTILIGNATSFIGCMIMFCIGFLKTKKQILAAQCVQSLLIGLGHLVLGGIGGFVCSMLTIVRNLVCVRRRLGLGLKLLFIGLPFVLTINTLDGGLISWLPIFATILFTMFMDTKNDITLKAALMGTLAIWVVYDFHYRNYVTFVFDLLTICSNAVGICMIKKGK